MTRYWYECQERAMAPGIADGWPEVIPAPHTRNGRLVRREYPPPDPDERNAARCKAISEALGIEDESTSKQVEAIAALRAQLAEADRQHDATLAPSEQEESDGR